MLRQCVWLVGLAVAAGGMVTTARAEGFDWGTGTPESQGMSTAQLEEMWRNLAAHQSDALLVIRNDRVVFERYANGYSRTKPHGTASLAKALVGGTSLMVAMNDGRIRPGDLASRYVPEWASVPRKREITVAELATHTSGIEDAEDGEKSHASLTGWKGDFWKRPEPPNDPFTLARDTAPVLDPPGTHARYSNPGMAMLAYCVTASLKGSPDPDLRQLLRHRILEPLGVPGKEWSVGYGSTVTVGGLPLVACWGGAAYSPNAAARVGRLMLRRGDWDGTRILSERVVEQGTTYAGLPNRSGLGWWVNREPNGTPHWKSAPLDAFWGAGAQHQFLLVIPSLHLILVRNGNDLEPGHPYDDGLKHWVVDPLMKCFSGQSQTPYPPSPVIRSVAWAPVESIVRRAHDSDNWPLTWGDDDRLYTAYGDGRGFEPFLPDRLSLGFARVSGGPESFQGENLRAPSGEQTGNGMAGKKASGILMVDGLLYLWVRNAGNSQLAWSSDHGATWKWSDWKWQESFGCPTFLQFGKNYAGARDRYVYVYSQDAADAYSAADRMILARVPHDRIRERGAYEFYAGASADGGARWTRDLAARQPVFSAPGRCYRSSISYCAGLKRYLWCQTLPGKDPRFSGGFGIYDAPEPWGPWTTVYSTELWDVGPGDTSSFPTRWMSADGRTLYLVFSGGDNFSVRKATLTLAGDH